MISVDGASVLAQVIPVGLLVIAFEARQGPKFESKRGFTTVLLWIGRVLTAAIVLLATFIESTCIVAVSSEQAIGGRLAVLVYVGSYAFSIVVFVAILSAVLDNTGITGALEKRALRKGRR